MRSVQRCFYSCSKLAKNEAPKEGAAVGGGHVRQLSLVEGQQAGLPSLETLACGLFGDWPNPVSSPQVFPG